MDTDALGCPSCGVALDERALVFKSQTIESCPNCGSTVRTGDSFSGTNLTAVIAGDVAAIDQWLDDYEKKTTHKTVKRPCENTHELLWAVGTPHNLAIECHYDKKRTGFVAIRAVARIQAQFGDAQMRHLPVVSSRAGLQPFAIRQHRLNSSDGASSDGVWGMVQYINTNTLTTDLLTSVAKRRNDAMQIAQTEFSSI